MYKLENNVEWTTDLKEAFKHNVTRAKLIWSGTEINEQNYIRDLELDEERYISNYGFIGTATARKVELNLSDINNEINLENEEFSLKIGADYNGNTYYINYGNFIVDKPPENDETNGKKRVVAYDYMIKFNKPYTNRVTYPCTLKALLQDVCSQAEVELGSVSFLNDDFVVQDNQFEGATLREVLQNVGKCAFSWARIGQDNKLYLDFSLTPENTETITIDEYKSDAFKKANEYYGPVNQVTYADSNMEGQEARVKDQASIDLNGLKEIVIYDNVFAYTPTKRETLIAAGSNILGLTYMPITQLDLIGFAYLDCRDIIEVGTLDESTYTSRVFNHRITYNGTLHDGIVTEGTSNNEEAYKNTATDIYQNQQTRIIVDKANKQIQSVVEDVNEQNNKISQITQTVDELNSKISDIADITTSQESTNAKVLLENINESEPIMIKVHPTGSNISYLYPRANLYPSANLFMTTRTIRFTNLSEYRVTGDETYTSYKRYYSYDGTDYTLLVLGTDYTAGSVISGTIYENEYIDYELPMNLLWYDADNYDEFLLDYDSQTCQVRKRVQYNADGTTSLLPTETTHTFTYPTISLDDGDYEVELLGYSGAYIFVRMVTKNMYTSQYVLKSEMNSEITQTKSEINASVDQKLTGYSTTSEMNSAINMKANQITSSVSETYETKSNAQTNYSNINQRATNIESTVSQKVGNDEVISKINQSAEAVTIDANKININGTISANGNFKVKTDGKIECKGATIDDGIINLTDNGSEGSKYFSIDRFSGSNFIGSTTIFSDYIGTSKYPLSGGSSNADANMQVNDNFASEMVSSNRYMVDIIAYSDNANFSNKYAEISMTKHSNSNIYNKLLLKDNSSYLYIDRGNRYIDAYVDDSNSIASVYLTIHNENSSTTIYPNGITTPSVTQTSKESVKKNIEKYADNALEIIKNSDIYEYNFKSEENGDKKHIGFVIGDEGGNYKTPDEVISSDGQGINTYNMTSILWKAVQEQQKIIEDLQQEIKSLKEEE